MGIMGTIINFLFGILFALIIIGISILVVGLTCTLIDQVVFDGKLGKVFKHKMQKLFRVI